MTRRIRRLALASALLAALMLGAALVLVGAVRRAQQAAQAALDACACCEELREASRVG